jgi:hypothetical protein
VRDKKCLLFKPLSFGVANYKAVDNQKSHNILLESRLLGRIQQKCNSRKKERMKQLFFSCMFLISQPGKEGKSE